MKKKHEFRFIGITGDCPAISLMCNFTHHNGFFSCWYCYIRGETRQNKRQYDSIPLRLRSAEEFIHLSNLAEKTGERQFGHFGVSVVHDLLDIPLPYSIVIDYLHTTLLGHSKRIILALHNQLSPSDRLRLNRVISKQTFPRNLF